MDDKLIEISAAGLLQTTISGFPKTKARQHLVGEVTISNIRYIPYAQSEALRIDANSTSHGHPYKPTIQFTGVFYEQEDSPEVVSFKGTDNADYHIHPISMQDAQIETRCTCLDFYWRFATHNYQNDALYGDPPPPYRKKTDRPPANPTKSPGMCKHVIKFVDILKQTGIVTD